MSKRAKTEWEEDGWVLVELPQKALTLRDEIGQLKVSLIQFFFIPWPPGMSSQAHKKAEALALANYRKVVVSALDPKNSGARDWLIEHHPKYEAVNSRRAPYHVDAWISFQRAERALDQGNDDAAGLHVREAQHFLGQADEDFIANEVSETRSRVGRSGGAGTKRDAVREKFVRLLSEKRPKSGWESRAEAARMLSPLLVDFIEKRPTTNMKTENLERQLLRWLGDKDGNERKAYDASSRVLGRKE